VSKGIFSTYIQQTDYTSVVMNGHSLTNDHSINHTVE